MKTFKHAQTYYVCFSSIGYTRMITELTDEEDRKYFFQGQPELGAINGFGFGQHYSSNLAKAHDLFEAKACMIENIIREEDQPFISRARPFDSYGLMRELGLKNLPLLMGFFTDDRTKTVFEEVLKNG